MTTTLERFRGLIDQNATGDSPVLAEELIRTLDLDPERADDLTIAEIGDLLGLSADTLRYYEKAGLVRVPRTAGGRRRYDRAAVGRVIFITRLRASDMSIRDITHYLRLVDQGDHTMAERLEFMRAHRRRIEQRITDMQWALAVVDYKINSYSRETPCL